MCGTDAEFKGGSCSKVTCNKGLTIKNSTTKCSGKGGDKCKYICDKGFEPTGDHVCGMDGAFKGGGCKDQQGCVKNKQGQNPCAVSPGKGRGRDSKAACIDVKAPKSGYSCQCSHGFAENENGVCENVDECLNNKCTKGGDKSAACVDAEPGDNSTRGTSPNGGYSCKCSSGFKDIKGVCTGQDLCKLKQGICKK